MSKKLLVLSGAVLTASSLLIVSKVKSKKEKNNENSHNEPERREKIKQEIINPNIQYIQDNIITIMNKQQREKYDNDLSIILTELEKPYCDLDRLVILSNILKENIKLDVMYGETLRTGFKVENDSNMKTSCIF
jgi:hypothetical protein